MKLFCTFIFKVFSRLLRGIAWVICLFIPIRKNRIIVSNFLGNGYSDSPKYIIDKLLCYIDDLEIIWIVRDSHKFPSKIKTCEYGTLKYIYYLSTSKVWLSNCRFNYFFYKKPSQYYIQTWHGFALKQIEKDVLGTLNQGYERIAKRDSDATNVMISDSKFMTNLFKRSFWYNGEIKEYGLPRYDIIMNPDSGIIQRVRDYFKISDGCGIILYAPTFRQNYKLDVYDINYTLLRQTCQKKFKRDYKVIVRLHPNVANKAGYIQYDDFIINGSAYPDIQELLLSSDVVISDYSSLMIDFALSLKPCFIYASDITEYYKERNFYFDIKSIPFSIATSNEELESNILEYDKQSYMSRINSFFDSVGMIRSVHSSENCASLIYKIIYSHEFSKSE